MTKKKVTALSVRCGYKNRVSNGGIAFLTKTYIETYMKNTQKYSKKHKNIQKNIKKHQKTSKNTKKHQKPLENTKKNQKHIKNR